ncbi:MAG TPA: stage V sporulation protein AC [Candidatus Gallacutalibacter stercoravium]|nr:stage V sporulation protein AC [Candidatus Gallacutalibacter stercoravium]
MNQPTPKEYAKMAQQASPATKSWKNIPLAFLVGGLICTIGQLFFNLYRYAGLEEQDARGAVSVTLIGLGALLTALKVYDNIAKHAGAGTLVPITGFSNAIVSPAIEFKSEGFVMGIGAKMFTIAGPVLVYGISAAALYGLILFIFGLY